MRKSSTDFALNITRFLKDYLPLQRNYSVNTVLSYRDTFKILIRFIESVKKIDQFTMNDFNKKFILDFLEYLRQSGCSLSTANQRLAAIKSFAYYCESESAENISCLQEIITIRSTKTKGKEISYLSEDHVRLLINLPDINNETGFKHKAVLCVLYDTGARVQEICDLKVKDVCIGNPTTVRLTGKGNKIRTVPVTSSLSKLLEMYINKFHAGLYSGDRYLLFNRSGTKLSRDGVDYILKKYAKIAREKDNSFPDHVHCHMLRHSKAVHMVNADIPIIYIRDFLGHSDISTTMIYAKADYSSKQKAIESLVPKVIDEDNSNKGCSDWTDDQDLMEFLNHLK